MYLKNDRIVVTIKGINFRSYRTGNGGEFVLDPTALTGWDDGTNTRRDATVRPVSNGDFVEPWTLSARLIAISGTAVATSRGELQRMHDTLTGLIAPGEYTEIRVETSVGVRYAIVGLENQVEWVQQLDNVAIFRAEFYAPDPHIYGAERIVALPTSTVDSGGLKYSLQYPLNYNVEVPLDITNSTLTNKGNAIAWPRFKVTGDFYSGFTITDGKDRKVTYTGIVTKSSPIEIDMARGTAIQGGVDKSVLLSDRQWISILPGDTIRPVFKPLQAASGWCDIIIRDTYI